MINKNKFSIKDTKKVLHKVGKRWVVVSAVLLGLAAGGAAVTTANADTTAQAAQPTVAQQVPKNANMSAANHSFGVADPANATKAPASSTMKLGADNGVNGLVNSVKSDAQGKLSAKGLPYTVNSAKAAVKNHASYADVNHLTELASLANKNSAKSNYADLVNLANNNNGRLSNGITVGYDHNNNVYESNQNTAFGMLDHAITDINAINGVNANNKSGDNVKLNKVASYLSDTQSLAANNSGVSRTFDTSYIASLASKFDMNFPALSVPVPSKYQDSSFAVPASEIALALGAPASLASSFFSDSDIYAGVKTNSLSVNPSFNVSLNVPTLVNSGFNTSASVSSVASAIVNEASVSISSEAQSIATNPINGIDSQVYAQSGSLDRSLDADVSNLQSYVKSSAVSSLQASEVPVIAGVLSNIKISSMNSTIALPDGSKKSITIPVKPAKDAASILHISKISYPSSVYSVLNRLGSHQDIVNKLSTNDKALMDNAKIILGLNPNTITNSSASTSLSNIAFSLKSNPKTQKSPELDEIAKVQSLLNISPKKISDEVNELTNVALNGGKFPSSGKPLMSSNGVNNDITSVAASGFNSELKSMTGTSNISSATSILASNITSNLIAKGALGSYGPLATSSITSSAITSPISSMERKVGTDALDALGISPVFNKITSYASDANSMLDNLNTINNTNNVNAYNDLVSNAANLANDFNTSMEPSLYDAYSNIANDANALLTNPSLKSDTPKYNTINSYGKSAISDEASSLASSMSTVSASMYNTLTEAKNDNTNTLENTLLSSVINKLSAASASYNNSLVGQDTSEVLDNEAINFMSDNAKVGSTTVVGTPNETFNAQSLTAPANYSLANDATDKATITINNGSANVDVNKEQVSSKTVNEIVNYVYNNSVVGSKVFNNVPANKDTTELATAPAGYEFMDNKTSEDIVLNGQKSENITIKQVPSKTVNETVNYVYNNSVVGSKVFNNVPTNKDTTESATAPAGYEFIDNNTSENITLNGQKSENIAVKPVTAPSNNGGNNSSSANNNSSAAMPFDWNFNFSSSATSSSASANNNYNSSSAESKVRYADYVTVNKALQLHTSPNFTKKNGAAVIKPNTRLDLVKTFKYHGLVRYEVLYNGKNYFITGKKSYDTHIKYELAKPASFRYLKVDKALQLHTSPYFTKKNGAMVVKPTTEFTINRAVKANGLTRYEVSYKGNVYFITAQSHYVENAYLQKNNFKKHGRKAVKVTRNLFEYKKLNFAKHSLIRSFRKGSVLPVKRVITIYSGEMTRLQLTNGRYVTANKDLVKVIK